MTEQIKVLCELTLTKLDCGAYCPTVSLYDRSGVQWRVDGIPDPTQPPPTTEFKERISAKIAESWGGNVGLMQHYAHAGQLGMQAMGCDDLDTSPQEFAEKITNLEREILKKVEKDNTRASREKNPRGRLEVLGEDGIYKTLPPGCEAIYPGNIYRLAPKPEPRYEPLDIFGTLDLRLKYLVDAKQESWRVDKLDIPSIGPTLIYLSRRGSETARTPKELLNEGWTYEDGTPVARKVE